MFNLNMKFKIIFRTDFLWYQYTWVMIRFCLAHVSLFMAESRLKKLLKMSL